MQNIILSVVVPVLTLSSISIRSMTIVISAAQVVVIIQGLARLLLLATTVNLPRLGFFPISLSPNCSAGAATMLSNDNEVDTDEPIRTMKYHAHAEYEEQ